MILAVRMHSNRGCRFGDEAAQGWMGYFGQALKTSANYLPSQVTDMLNQGRDFAFARMPTCGLANVCAIAKLASTDCRSLLIIVTGFELLICNKCHEMSVALIYSVTQK